MGQKPKISARGAARAAARSTRASARLEGRIVTDKPPSAQTLHYVAAHPPRLDWTDADRLDDAEDECTHTQGTTAQP